MAASPKSLLSLILLLLVVVAHGTQIAMAQSSTCTTQLSELNVCAPFVVPGVNTNPSSRCCNALQAVDRDCLCSTIRIASQLPSQCQIPSLGCSMLLTLSYSFYSDSTSARINFFINFLGVMKPTYVLYFYRSFLI
ncbi:Stamen-specific protein FIL1 [Glycine soja]|uniref:Stamen-specific protein FIL1 n=1 Tax=Glycine soja TaxID=3848 RepID=A0A0B2NV49_GLYSO|nr:Stamen-specific protein FIL1 [Glycine soja]